MTKATANNLPLAWLSNDPQATAQLLAADAAFEAAMKAASKMVLADKIVAIREAKIARAKAYADIGGH